MLRYLGQLETTCCCRCLRCRFATLPSTLNFLAGVPIVHLSVVAGSIVTCTRSCKVVVPCQSSIDVLTYVAPGGDLYLCVHLGFFWVVN